MMKWLDVIPRLTLIPDHEEEMQSKKVVMLQPVPTSDPDEPLVCSCTISAQYLYLILTVEYRTGAPYGSRSTTPSLWA